MNCLIFAKRLLLPIAFCLVLTALTSPAAAAPPVAPAEPDNGTAFARYGGAILLNGTADGAHALAAADLDRDGDTDVVSAARGDGEIIWYRSNGVNPPTFEAVTIDVLPGAYALFAGDINGDGAVDLAAAAVGEVQPSSPAEPAAGTGRIVWYENNRAVVPEFIRRDVITTLEYPVAVHGADLDRDGDMDLLSASRDSGRLFWYANGGGATPSFTAHLISEAYSGTVAVHAGDLDGDGDPDVVAAAEDVDVIVWFESDGAPLPQFSPHVIRSAGPDFKPEFDYAKTILIADLDNDGDNDIAYGSEEAKEVGWYANDGATDPTFSLRVISNEIDHVKSIQAADLDRDGDLDLVTTSTGDNRVVVFDNDGAADPTFFGRELATGLMGARATAAADLTGDGRLDLVTASRDDDRVLWFPNQMIHHSALFQPAGRHEIDTRFRMRHATSGDIDGDGDVDVLTISDKELVWHMNDGASPPGFAARPISAGLNAGRWSELADLDGDGDLDAIAASTNSNTVYWYENQGGRFDEHVLNNRVDGVRVALAGDVDGDGDLDVYTASHGDHRITWFENLGGTPPAFTPHVVTDNALYARSVYGADLDGDGDLDLMSASQSDNMVRWYQNDGARPPRFTAYDLTSAEGMLHVHADDVDSDGDMDILFVAENAATIGWLENLGGATPEFVRHDVDTAAAVAHAVTTGDVDRDGDIDLVAAVEGLNAVIWYENVGGNPTRFLRSVVYDKALVAHGIHVDDLDRDGDLDILSASRDDGVAAWFENLGGQYAIGVDAASSSALIPGQWQRLATIVAAHRGRSGNADVMINRLDLVFSDREGRLDTNAVNSRIDQLGLYRDANGDNLFDPAVDTPVLVIDQLILTDDGRLPVAIAETQSSLATVANGRPATFFVGAVLTGECADPETAFSMSLQLTAGTALDDWHRTPLLADGMRNLTSVSSTGEDTAQNRLLINEIMADNNVTLEDPQEPGEFPDWIEIYNDGSAAANLGGLYLTDDLEQPTKYRIPDGVTIPPFGYLVFIADGDFTQGPLHTNFRLDRSGEAIALFDRDVNGNLVLDVLAYEEQEPDISFGRPLRGGETAVSLPFPTPGMLNTEVPLDVSVFLPILYTARKCR